MKTLVRTILVFHFSFALFHCSFAQHTVVMKSGDKKKGIVLELKHDTLYFAESQEMTIINMVDISSIFFDEYVAYDGRLMEKEPEKRIQSGKYLITYRMKDRTMIKPPVISNGTLEKGKVVVEVIINRSGRVIKTKPGAIGSTTTSEYLYTKAKFAAQGAIFNKHDTAPIETNGTVTITY
ncbi:MAG: hypothetical protein COA57_13275 [Flavobacteriales bacterium]|nr:hypothetical protein [Bacteroidales bacterium AH-315-I05]PCJ82424.1 MAG: hypothetical protein COA57_13275 [Flavobacteriales bacterium]